MKKILLYSILLSILTLVLLSVFHNKLMDVYLDWEKSNLPAAVKVPLQVYGNQNQAGVKIQKKNDNSNYVSGYLAVDKSEGNKPPTIPEELNLSVPFTPQAPYADWSMPYQEACEEASVLMAVYYWQDKKFTKAIAKQEIDNMVSWQRKEFGGHYDLNVAQTAEMIDKYFTGFQSEIITDLTIEKIKYYLSQGYPVIVPAAGRELHNPYFSGDGPRYHMLVIKGYTKNKFITNDPGTKRGENYVYNFEVLMNAIHDWTGTAPDGEKIGLTIKPI